jgi:class 3 adenylate cyclase/TolB-like protein
MSETRKLAAILVADVVGYGRLAGADEDRTLARLRGLRSDLIDPATAAHHGRVVKRTGDGSIVEFRSVVDAVRCAIEVQNGLIERNAGVREDRRIQFRVGIHIGDVVEESDGDLMGDGVNIAARLEGVAKPGGICLSEDAYRQVKGRLELKVSDLGLVPLKNIAEPIRAYSLEVGQPAQALPAVVGPSKTGVPEPKARGWSSRFGALAAKLAVAFITAETYVWHSGLATRLMGASAEDKLATAPGLSIVVLPFENLSGDKEQDYFADGITDDLTTDLSHILDSFVIARNTAFTFKGKAIDVKEIGRDLGVRYALEGSVHRVGDVVTINAQLITTETGAQIWAERFEGERAKLGELQVDVVARIANALGAELIRAESLRALREQPDNPDAIDLAMRARLAVLRMDNKEGMDEYEQALKLDPNLARAQAGLAFALANLASYPGATDRDAYLDRAERLADQALAARPDEAYFLLAKANVLATKKQPEAAILEGEAAIKSDPNFAAAYGYLGIWRALAGRSEQGFADVETARRLSPHDPLLWLWEWTNCTLHVQLAQWDQAIAPCQQAAAANPKLWQAHIDLAAAYGWLGREAEAKAEVAEALKLFPGATVKGAIAYYSSFSDNPVFLQQMARQAEGWRKAGLPEGDTKTN